MTIYFIQQGDSGPIKIGRSDDVQKRLSDLQTANPYSLKLLGTTSSWGGTELKLHKRFAKYRLCGEWFEPVHELFDLIKKRCPANWERKPNGYWFKIALENAKNCLSLRREEGK